MTTFDKRENAFEAKLAHDEELKFKATARRNKWFGLWAAEKIGKNGDEAEAYAATLAPISSARRRRVFTKLRADFDAARVARPIRIRPGSTNSSRKLSNDHGWLAAPAL